MHVMRHFCDIDFGFVWTAALYCDGGDDNQIMKKCWFNLCIVLVQGLGSFYFILALPHTHTHTDRYRCAREIGLNSVKKKFSVSTIDGYVTRFPLDIFCNAFFFLSFPLFLFFLCRFRQAIIKWWFHSLCMCFFFSTFSSVFQFIYTFDVISFDTTSAHIGLMHTFFSSSSSSMIYFPSLSNVTRLHALVPVAVGMCDRFRSFVRFT